MKVGIKKQEVKFIVTDEFGAEMYWNIRLKADYMSVREKPLRILRINFLPMLLIWLYRH